MTIIDLLGSTPRTKIMEFMLINSWGENAYTKEQIAHFSKVSLKVVERELPKLIEVELLKPSEIKATEYYGDPDDYKAEGQTYETGDSHVVDLLGSIMIQSSMDYARRLCWECAKCTDHTVCKRKYGMECCVETVDDSAPHSCKHEHCRPKVE